MTLSQARYVQVLQQVSVTKQRNEKVQRLTCDKIYHCVYLCDLGVSCAIPK